jgi:hypothetical protein
MAVGISSGDVTSINIVMSVKYADMVHSHFSARRMGWTDCWRQVDVLRSEQALRS